MEMTILLGNGFLPTRGSFMLDLVAVSMIFVSVALAFSIYQVRSRRKRQLHRTIQISLAILLAIALLFFELDVRFFTDWKELARPSPFFDSGTVHWCLWIHLCFAIPTPIIWAILLVTAWRGFRDSFEQGSFNRIHRIGGRIGALFMFATAITGWIFYYTAFVA